jgi:Ca2+-binding EF-hand superfamily protein
MAMFRMVLGLVLAGTAFADEPKKPADVPARSRPTPEQIVDMILVRMDTNKDGKISRDEAKDRVKENFDAIDTNKDGYLDRTELLAMARRMAPMMPPPGGRPGGPFGGPGPARPDPLDFDALDKNADGRLTRDELKGTRWLDVFDKIDTNHDGKIDPKEWAAYHGLKK